jgi:hypothetical protein
MKCNETQGKWCKNKHGASKIIDTFETYHPASAQKESVSGKKRAQKKPGEQTAHQADHPGMNTTKHLIPAKKDIANQSITGEK